MTAEEMKQEFNALYNLMANSNKVEYMHVFGNVHKEMMGAIQSLNEKVDASRHSFWQDFGANVAGNAVFDGLVWLASRLVKKL